MATNERILQKVYAGIETVRGTATAATRKVYADLTVSIDRSLVWARSRTGTYNARRKSSYSRIKVTFSGSDSATYEDLPWWLKHFLRGGVTGVTDAGTPPAYTYTFIPSLSTDDLAASTFEYNEEGNPMRSPQVMANTWSLVGDPDNDQQTSWMINAEFMALDVETGATFTPAIPERATEEIIARGTKVFINDTPAAIGTTQKLGSLIDWSIAGDNKLHFKAFAENERGFAPNKVGRQERTHDAQFTFEFEDAVELEKYLSDVPVLRCIRLEREGTIIHTTVRKRLRVDMVGYWSSWAGSDREGNLTAVFGLQTGFDPTFASDIKVYVTNALATLP